MATPKNPLPRNFGGIRFPDQFEPPPGPLSMLAGELALAGGTCGQEGIQAQGADGPQNRMDVAMGAGADDAEGLLSGEEGLSLERLSEHLDQRRGEMGEVGQGAMPHLSALPVGMTQQMGDISFPPVLASNRGHMHTQRFSCHVAKIGCFLEKTRVRRIILGYKCK